MYTFILTAIYRLGFKNTAIRLADKWQNAFVQSAPPLHNAKRYNAAWYLSSQVQTIYPVCGMCNWHIEPLDPHHWCEDEMRSQAEEMADIANELGASMANESDDDLVEVDDAFEGFGNDFDDEEDNEDPLAGDVDPTGGYYEEPMHPFEAQRLSVMRQHGDYTG